MTTLICVRHGNAERGEEGAPDYVRKLSELGLRQAGRRRDLIRPLGPIGLAISSGTARTNETAAIVADVQANSVIALPSLFTPQGENDESAWCKAVLESAFKALGYAPLAEYFKHAEVKRALEWYAIRAWNQIIGVLIGQGANTDRARVVIGAHAIYIPMILWLIFPAGREKLEAYNMAECGCVSVTLDCCWRVFDIVYHPDVHQDPAALDWNSFPG